MFVVSGQRHRHHINCFTVSLLETELRGRCLEQVAFGLHDDNRYGVSPPDARPSCMPLI